MIKARLLINLILLICIVHEINAQQNPSGSPGNCFDCFNTDLLPEFVGGTVGLTNYIHKNMIYPKTAKANNIQGRTVLKFRVAADGTVYNISVLSGLGYGTDEEAVRLLSNSPKWKPGLRDGRPTDMPYIAPVFFRLSNEPAATPMPAQSIQSSVELPGGGTSPPGGPPM